MCDYGVGFTAPAGFAPTAVYDNLNCGDNTNSYGFNEIKYSTFSSGTTVCAYGVSFTAPSPAMPQTHRLQHARQPSLWLLQHGLLIQFDPVHNVFRRLARLRLWRELHSARRVCRNRAVCLQRSLRRYQQRRGL